MHMSKRSTCSNLTCSSEVPLITKMYLHREIHHPCLEHVYLPERWNYHEHLEEMFTSLAKLEVEVGSLAQKWAPGLQSFTVFSVSAVRLWAARVSGHSHCDCLMGDYELPICLMQKIPWADTFSSQLRTGHPNFQAARFSSEIKLIYSSCH